MTSPAGLRQNDTGPDCLIRKLTCSLLEESGEENGSVIGLLITGSGVLRLEPMTVNGCVNGKSGEGKKLQDEPTPALSADGDVRQINGGHVLTSQSLFELQNGIVPFVSGAEIGEPRD